MSMDVNICIRAHPYIYTLIFVCMHVLVRKPWRMCLPACMLTFICLYLHFKDSGQCATAALCCDLSLTEL